MGNSSPKVLTALLLIFAIGLGIIFLNISKEPIENFNSCSIDVGLSLLLISEDEQLCYDSNKKIIRFTVENGVNTNINSLLVNVISSNNEENFEISDSSISKAGNYVGTVPFDQEIHGKISTITIIPNIILNDRVQQCNKDSIQRDFVSLC